MASQFKTVQEVVDWRMCLGCGACAYICPDKRIELYDCSSEGIRPAVRAGSCGTCRACLDVCPSFEIKAPLPRSADTEDKRSFTVRWGPVLAMWEGFATNPDIRFKGASGGAITAISAYCIEVLGMYGALHIGQDPDSPLRNRTRLSRNLDQLVEATGSRYSPASVCNGLELVERAPVSCVVIGKPSDIAAVAKARQLRPALDKKVGLTLSFFCAGTPSAQGTLDLLARLGIRESSVHDLRYRGLGWPGEFRVKCGINAIPAPTMSYQESWQFLQAYRPWSVHLWPDGTGELADISCGDPWCDRPDGKNPGSSLVIARTELGREIVQGAIKAGYLNLSQAEEWKLTRSQSNLLIKKGAVWGRRFALKLIGLPVTRLSDSSLWHCWTLLPWRAKIKSVIGTMRRVIARRLFRRRRLDLTECVPVQAAFLCETQSRVKERGRLQNLG